MSTRPGSFISTHISDLGPQGQSEGSDSAALSTTNTKDKAGAPDLGVALDCQSPEPVPNLGSADAFGGNGSVTDLGDRDAVRAAQRELRDNQAFRTWLHRPYKQGQVVRQGSHRNPNLDPDEVLEAWREWKASGCPGWKRRRRRQTKTRHRDGQ